MFLGRKLDALVRAHAAQGTFSGAVLVARGSRVVLRRPYGLADAELGVPNRPEHAFRIGSVAKILTALAVLRFLERARLPLSTPLSKFVPEFPGADLLTLHHLLSNTSGVADYLTREDASVWWGRPHTLTKLTERIAAEPRLFGPGERFGYSNANWALLAAVLDRTPGGELVRKAGIMAVVVAGGTVRPGDAISVELPISPFARLEPV